MQAESSNKPFVSVIIPSYRDWKRLILCLGALNKQTLSKDLYEVIVVNNDPSDKIPSDFFIPENTIIIEESKKGSYAARNAGIKKAKGNLLAFTDADCIPDINWLANAVSVLSANTGCMRLAGKIELFFRGSKATLAEKYEAVFAFDQQKFIRKDDAAVTANMFALKRLFDRVGGFNEHLFSGGDIDWGRRASKAGYPIFYAENVIVHHPARNSVKELKAKRKRVAGGTGVRMKSRKRSLNKFIKIFLPPKNTVRTIRVKGSELTLLEKVEVYVLRYYLSIVGGLEAFKITRGKIPHR